MPLDKSGSKESVGNNIRAELDAGKPRRQAIAIALNTARKYRDAGGAASSTPWYTRHSSNLMLRGPVLGTSMGRADKVNANLANGSHVIPADIVSHVGQGNSLAGMTKLGQMLGPQTVRTPKPNFPKLPNAPKLPKMSGMAKGGKTNKDDEVPCALSHGEFIVSPEVVRHVVGHGDEERGHKILDHFILHLRHQAIETLKRLPGPAKGDE